MSLRTLLITGTALLSLFLGAFAAGLDTVDPKCPRGTFPGFEVNTFQYNVPQSEFNKKIGSFLHAEWWTGPVNSTQGRDNTAGALRTATFDGTTFAEKLVEFVSGPGKFSMRYVLVGDPVVFGGSRVVTYTEELSAISICSGNATYIVFSANYCSERPNAYHDFYDHARRLTMDAVAKDLNAIGFSGSCLDGLP